MTSAYPTVTGTAIVTKANEVVLFIPPSDRKPTRLVRDGFILRLEDENGVVSEETYGPLTIGKLKEVGGATVVEVAKDGHHGRTFQFKVVA